MFISRTICRRNQNLNKEHFFRMRTKQRSLWIQLWNFSNEWWKLMRLYRLWNLDLWTRLKKFCQLGLTSWQKLSPTISEIQVESRIINECGHTQTPFECGHISFECNFGHSHLTKLDKNVQCFRLRNEKFMLMTTLGVNTQISSNVSSNVSGY